MSDHFSTAFSDDELSFLIRLGKKYGFDPLSSVECEKYFTALLQKYDDSDGDKIASIEDVISKSFLFLEQRPVWVQTADWQFDMGNPMLFVGQKEITIEKGPVPYSYTFYIFWNTATGQVKTVVQSD